MKRDDRSSIVADGRERICSGSHYQKTKHALTQRMKRRCAPLLARSSLVGRLIIHFRTQRWIQRRLNRIAPPQGLYLAPPSARDHALHLTKRWSEPLTGARSHFK
jgi:hypothetical protein